MNSNRKAELQRKLMPGAAPRPPAGLAERIKADIPNDLTGVPQRSGWPARATGPMRLAASILLVITSIVMVMYVVAPDAEKKSAATVEAARPVIFAPAPRAVASEPMAPAAATRTEEVRLDLAVESEAPRLPTRVAQATSPSDAGLEGGIADAVEETSLERDAEAQVLAGAGRTGESLSAAAPAPQIAEAAPKAEPEPAPAPAPASADFAAAPPVSQAMVVTAEAPLVARREQSRAKSATTVTGDIFGITVNPAVFENIREILRSGHHPPASAVDVEAVVNYFAGPSLSPPRSGVRLDVEASPAVIATDGDHAVLRFTIDTPPATGRTPVVATDARVDIVFNDAVVRIAQRVGDGEPLVPQPTLVRGTSVTGLYALELKSGLSAEQVVATVRLQYSADGARETIARTLHARDLSGEWQRASRRHRLATLGALWAQTLKGLGSGTDVARRAEELATERPGDDLARELASAANASAGGR